MLILNDIDLQVRPFNLHAPNILQPARQNKTIYRLPREDGVAVPRRVLSEKIISLDGSVIADTEAAAKTAYNRLVSLYRVDNSVLTSNNIEYSGFIDNIAISLKPYQKNRLPIKAQFFVPGGYGILPGEHEFFTPISNTSGNQQIEINFNSNWLIEPIIFLTAKNDKNSVKISLSTSALPQVISVTTDLEAGDVITINSSTLQVLKNTENIIYSGRFPYFQSATTDLVLNISDSTLNYDLRGAYESRWL